MELSKVEMSCEVRVLQGACVTALPAAEGQGVRGLSLRFSGPAGARVEHVGASGAPARLRFGALTPGWWTAEGQAFDEAGRPLWAAPEVRFRADATGEASITLQFSKRSAIF